MINNYKLINSITCLICIKTFSVWLQLAQVEEEKKHLEFMASMRQYDPDPPADDENAKDRPKDDPVVDLFPDDETEDRNSKCT